LWFSCERFIPINEYAVYIAADSGEVTHSSEIIRVVNIKTGYVEEMRNY
jgi:hypothetical protein